MLSVTIYVARGGYQLYLAVPFLSRMGWFMSCMSSSRRRRYIVCSYGTTAAATTTYGLVHMLLHSWTINTPEQQLP
jgi:hypothetical protein